MDKTNLHINMEIKTVVFFNKLCRALRFTGVGDLWFKQTERSFKTDRSAKALEIILNILIILVFIMEVGGVTLDSLDTKQKFDNLIFIVAQSTFLVYILTISINRDDIRELVAKQCVYLPGLYVKKEVELSMIKDIKIYTFIFFSSVHLTLMLYGVGGIVKVINGGVFTTLIVIWPSMDDRSTLADIIRVLYYILWYFMMTKMVGTLVFVFSQTICLRHRFLHLQYYFLELSEIFNENLTQIQKEKKFEEKFIFGIKMHAETIWCGKAIQKSLGAIYSGQTTLNLLCLVLLMAQMLASERTILNLSVAMLTAVTVLLTTGAFMWNAGDVTVEASKLPDAIFYSGWHNCTDKASTRIKSLLILSIRLGQIPVIIKAFAIIPMSYSTYVSIVKSSYSIFTVLY